MIAKDTAGAINALQNVINEHQQDVFTEGEVVHNQNTLTTLISLYTNSKYEDTPDENSGVVFFNILNKDLDNTNKKTNIDSKNLALMIKDKVINYLLNAGNTEFKDDYEMGTWLDLFKEDYNKFGTVVTKNKYISKKDSVVEVIPWGSIICNPNSWEAAPQAIQKEVRLNDVIDNDLYDTEQFEARLQNHDNATVMSYELHGLMKEGIMTGNFEDKKRKNQQHIYFYIPGEFLQSEEENKKSEGEFFVVASSYEKKNPLSILKKSPVPNRTMGRGVIEMGMDAQIVSNEVANLMIEELRAVAKIVRWSDDEELDGVDTGEIDSNTVINVAHGRKFGQLQANTVAFGELQNYLNMWGVQNQDESATQDVSLGKQEKSGTPFRSTLLRKGEVDSVHDQSRDKLVLAIEKLYKDTWLNIIIDYFDSQKDITSLLMDEQLQNFYVYLADRLAEKAQVEAVLNRKPPVEDRTLLVNTILSQIQDSDFKITDFSDSWDKKNIIDKTRVLISAEKIDVEAKLATLTALHASVSQNPGAYPNLNAADILSQIVALSDNEAIVDLFKQTKQVPAPQPGPGGPVLPNNNQQ